MQELKAMIQMNSQNRKRLPDLEKELMVAWWRGVHTCSVMCDSANLWTIAYQAPLSMGFSRQEYWNGLPCPPPADLLDPGIEPTSLRSPALADGFLTTGTTWERMDT